MGVIDRQDIERRVREIERASDRDAPALLDALVEAYPEAEVTLRWLPGGVRIEVWHQVVWIFGGMIRRTKGKPK